MNRHVIESPPSLVSTATKATAQHVKPADAPWWQLYSVLIITIGAGIVVAVNDPSLLHNPIALLIGIGAFFGFVMVWCNKHAREIEAEDWQPPIGRMSVSDEDAPTSTHKEQAEQAQARR